MIFEFRYIKAENKSGEVQMNSPRLLDSMLYYLTDGGCLRSLFGFLFSLSVVAAQSAAATSSSQPPAAMAAAIASSGLRSVMI